MSRNYFAKLFRGRKPGLWRRSRNDAGYTLLELLVLMGILARADGSGDATKGLMPEWS